MSQLPPESTQCPKCHEWGLLSGYDPGATWAECPTCKWATAVPDENWPALIEAVKNPQPHIDQ